MTYFIGNNLIDYEGIQPSTMEECIAYLKEQAVIGLDIETSRLYPKGRYDESIYKPGLDPYVSRIIMIQVGTLEKRFVIDARSVDYSSLKEILQDKNILKVGHNLQFEGKFFLQHLKSPIFNVWDCMIVEKLLYNGNLRSYSLATLMKDYLGIKSVVESNLFENNNSQIEDLVNRLEEQYLFLGKHVDRDDLYNEAIESLEEQETVDKSIRKGFVNMKDEPFTLEQILYGDLDITGPLRIYELQRRGRYVKDWVDGQEIEDHFYPEIGIKLENKVTQVLAEISWRGMEFDPQRWSKLYEDNFELWLRQRQFLDSYVTENHPEFTGSIDLFNDKPSCAVDWNYHEQVYPSESSQQTRLHH